jgi:hypothetical protein
MSADTSRHVATIPKNKGEEVRVTVDDFKGHRLVNVRVWYRAEDGKMWPGKQGLAVRLDLAADLARAIAEAAS